MEPHRIPIKIDTSVDCPSDCLMCSGEACNLCGAGCWSYIVDCDHDTGERHETPSEIANVPVLVRTEDFGGPAVQLPSATLITANEILLPPTTTPTPHELWRQAGGDQQTYHDLMIEHGLLIDRSKNPPEAHKFEGKTLSCACESCGGKADAPWHTWFADASLTEAERKNLFEGMWTDTGSEPSIVTIEGFDAWKCACGWAGNIASMPVNASGGRVCPECGASGGLELAAAVNPNSPIPPVTLVNSGEDWADSTNSDPLANVQHVIEISTNQADAELRGEVPHELPQSVGEKLDAMQEMAQKALQDLRDKRAGTRKVSHSAIPPLQKVKKEPPFKGECTCPPEGTEWDGPCDHCRNAYIISIAAFESGFPCSLCKGEVVHEEGCREKTRQDMIERIFDGEPIYIATQEVTMCFRCNKRIEHGSGAIVTSKGQYHMRPCQGVVAA